MLIIRGPNWKYMTDIDQFKRGKTYREEGKKVCFFTSQIVNISKK